MKKKLLSFIFSIFFIIFCPFVLTSCGNSNSSGGNNGENNGVNNLVIAPTQTYVISCLEKVPGVMEIEAVTEENDPNNLLNKAGGYYASIYFSYQIIKQFDIIGETLIEKGVDAGGCIEVYNTVDEATSRNEYLASFDGTFLASGSHKVVGTMVVRTSNELLASQQNKLESNIISVLTTGKDISVDTNIGENVNVSYHTEYYDGVILLPNTDNNRSYELCSYEKVLGNYRTFSKINLYEVEYYFNDYFSGLLIIDVYFKATVEVAVDEEVYFGVKIYNKKGSFITSTYLSFWDYYQGDEMDTSGEIDIDLEEIGLDLEDTSEGIRIEFTDYYFV